MAIACDVLDAVCALLAIGADPRKEARDYDSRPGTTVEQFVFPLAVAARSGNVAILNVLIEAGVDVNQRLKCPSLSYENRKSRNMTALHWASAYGQEDMVAALLAAGGDVSIKGEDDGSSPLAKAVSKGFCKVVSMLVEAGCDPNAELFNAFDERRGERTMLILAIHGGHTSTAAELIALGAKVNSSHMVLSPLVCAVAHGNIAMVELLLTHGANPNHLSTNLGRTALLVATRSNHVDIAQLLVTHGANLTQSYIGPERDKGASPLHIAAKFGYVLLVEFFLKMQVNPNTAKTSNGYTPLLFATQYRRHHITYLLLLAGANPNDCSNRGLIPIHNAAHSGDTAMLFLLASFGADLSISMNGQNAARIAELRGNRECKTWLLQVENWSPLRIAINCRQRFAVKFLIQNGMADPDRESHLMIAATSESPSNFPICNRMACLVKNVQAGWGIKRHPLFHAGFQEAIHTLFLVALSLSKLSENASLPHVPPELWHYMCRFLNRTDFKNILVDNGL
jgi:ankyrin repeat protein